MLYREEDERINSPPFSDQTLRLCLTVKSQGFDEAKEQIFASTDGPVPRYKNNN